VEKLLNSGLISFLPKLGFKLELPLKIALVQFGSHRGLQGSHIGGHIVYIYNVSAGERELGLANV